MPSWSGTHVLVGCCLIPPAALHPMYLATPEIRRQVAGSMYDPSQLIFGSWSLFTTMIPWHGDQFDSLSGWLYLGTLLFLVPVFVGGTVLFVAGPSLHAAHRLFQGPGALEQERQELLEPTLTPAEPPEESPRR